MRPKRNRPVRCRSHRAVIERKKNPWLKLEFKGGSPLLDKVYQSWWWYSKWYENRVQQFFKTLEIPNA